LRDGERIVIEKTANPRIVVLYSTESAGKYVHNCEKGLKHLEVNSLNAILALLLFYLLQY
jgi:hypothetical protein